MRKRTRLNHAPAFKDKVALAVLKGEKTLAELAQQFDVPPNYAHRRTDTGFFASTAESLRRILGGLKRSSQYPFQSGEDGGSQAALRSV